MNVAEIFEPKPKPIIGMGCRFKRITSGEFFILAKPANGMLALICLKDGNCWDGIIKVGNACNITKSEAESIFGDLDKWETAEPTAQ